MNKCPTFSCSHTLRPCQFYKWFYANFFSRVNFLFGIFSEKSFCYLVTSSKFIAVEPRLIWGKICQIFGFLKAYLEFETRFFNSVFRLWYKLFWRMKNNLGFHHTQNNCTKMMTKLEKTINLKNRFFASLKGVSMTQ